MPAKVTPEDGAAATTTPPTSATSPAPGSPSKKGKPKRKKTEGVKKANSKANSKGKNKKVISFEGYWVKEDGVGNRFLRDAFGGHGHDDVSSGADEWEFRDVAAALVSSKIKGIQNLHDSMAPQIASGASYADLADNINIPDRVFLIPMLIAAFDKSIAEKKIKGWVPPIKDGQEQTAGTAAATAPLGHYADHTSGEEDKAQQDLMNDGGSPVYRAKGWNDIAKQAGVGNKKSSACNIL